MYFCCVSELYSAYFCNISNQDESTNMYVLQYVCIGYLVLIKWSLYDDERQVNDDDGWQYMCVRYHARVEELDVYVSHCWFYYLN